MPFIQKYIHTTYIHTYIRPNTTSRTERELQEDKQKQAAINIDMILAEVSTCVCSECMYVNVNVCVYVHGNIHMLGQTEAGSNKH